MSSRSRSPLRCGGATAAAPPASHALQHALDDLLEVGLALAQVLVLHLVELARQHFELRRQRPLGVVVPLDDPLLGGAGERLVVQQHQVHVEQRRQFVRRVVRQLALQRAQLADDRVAGGAQALDLGLDLRSSTK